MNIDGIGEVEILNNWWFTLPNWVEHKTQCVGIVKYTNDVGEEKTVIGLCLGHDIETDIRMVVAGGVPCRLEVK